MSFLPGSWRAWINRSAAGPFLNADSLNDWEMKFRALDCLGAVRALGLVDALPGSPADGDAYLTSAAATPANKIVRRFNGAWEAFTPINGMVAFLADGSAKQFLSGSWGDADFGGGVASVFGRTGAVTAQTGDYTPEQVGALPGNNPTWTGTLQGGTGATFRMTALQGGLGNDFVCADEVGFIRKVTPAQALENMQGLAAYLKGAANGVAELGADGRVPTSQLPSYVDDVLEYANFAAFPATGETGKIYINLDQNKTWRWSGSAYVEISASLALGETSSTAYRGDRGKTAYDHSQSTGNPHATTPSDIGAAPVLAYFDTVDADDINGGEPGLYTFFATSFVNFWPGISSGRASMIQLETPTGLTAQLGIDNETGGWYTRFQLQVLSGAWSPWFSVWDSGQLPVSSFMKTVLDDANAPAARATLGAAPLAGAEILIHSDFGRSATTDLWQSAFTDNAAAGLQFAANTTASGTRIVIESLCSIPADSGGTVQVCIGPQLSGEDSPSGSTYAIVLSPGTSAGEAYGNGILRIEIELIGSGSSITGHVVASFLGSGQAEPRVQTGTITVDGTQNRTLDLRFNPFGTTAYTFLRNRVFRRNP